MIMNSPVFPRDFSVYKYGYVITHLFVTGYLMNSNPDDTQGT